MQALARLSDFLDAFVSRVGKLASWSFLFLIGITIFDVVSRRFFVLGSTKLQEAEWHFHAILFSLCLGYAYMADAHVRIDLVRERLSPRTQWWLELIGVLFFLLPYCAVVVYFGIDFAERSYAQHEISASATGLTHRWLIKSVIPIGFSILFLAGVAVALRKVIELFGPPQLSREVAEHEEDELVHLDPGRPAIHHDDANGQDPR
ncbi:MAG: TRAP transporter small permease subunit [Rhodobacterales bacterium]|nr:TRAP transporter small permease subunit [Rhodobacterales bacterium]